MNRFSLKVRLVAAGAMALALSACDERGVVDAPEPVTLAELSAIDELPYAPPAQVSYRPSAEGYAWAERAYGLQEAVYDTAPDYGFYYDEVEPLVWETADDWELYAEPWDDGYRYYYYEPGAAYPYFIRDRDYGYGYGAGGVLVAVFDLSGRYLPAETVYRLAPVAGRYYARGHDLRRVATKAPRIRVTEQVWSQRAPRVIRTADPWLKAGREDRNWRAWRDRDQKRELRRFEAEGQRRAAHGRGGREPGYGDQIATVRSETDHRRQDARMERQAERQLPRAQREGADGARPAHEQRLAHEADRRQQAQVEQRRQVAEARSNEARREEGRRQVQRQVEQQERRAQVQAQRQQAEQQRQHLQQQRQAEHRQQAERQQRAQKAPQSPVEPQHARQGPPTQARSAQQQGQPAAAREHGSGPGPGKGQGPGNGRGHGHED